MTPDFTPTKPARADRLAGQRAAPFKLQNIMAVMIRTASRSTGIELFQRARKVRDKMITGTSPTATIANDGNAASARRSSRANW